MGESSLFGRVTCLLTCGVVGLLAPFIVALLMLLFGNWSIF